MPADEKAIQAEIEAKGLTAPRVTPAMVDAAIASESYTVLPSGKVMVCELLLRNGFSVRGEASAVSKENFDIDIGRKVSRAKARDQIWQLEAYLLQDQLAGRSFSPRDGNFAGMLDGAGFIITREEILDNVGEEALLQRYRKLIESSPRYSIGQSTEA